MAKEGVGPKPPGAPIRPKASAQPQPKEAERPEPKVPMAPARPSVDRREQAQEDAQQKADQALTGEGRIGDEAVTGPELKQMGSLMVARHLMTLLAKARSTERAALVERVGDLLLALEDPGTIRRVLLEMESLRIVDIYPLELMAYVMERSAGLLAGIEMGEIILNRAELEAKTFGVEEKIVIKVPLSLKMRAFALEGGGTPGYCFAPGPPAEYHLEVGDAGHFKVLVRGDMRKKSIVDRVILRIEDRPE